jgi:hypothetical protein
MRSSLLWVSRVAHLSITKSTSWQFDQHMGHEVGGKPLRLAGLPSCMRRLEALESSSGQSYNRRCRSPIWMTENDTAALERQHGNELAAQTGGARSITGHIDFLQIQNGAVRILDYNPDAAHQQTDRPTCDLRSTRAHRARPQPQTLRHKARLVQRRGVLTANSFRQHRLAELGGFPPTQMFSVCVIY